VVLLDTHFWIWWLTPGSPLTPAERAGLDQAAAQDELKLSAISLWEAQMLHAKQRLVLPLPFPEWLQRAADRRLLQVLPIDTDVIVALYGLPTRLHGDPADRMIVATARAHGLPLATRDAEIRRSRTVRLWKA
jgi:PIN domain nuclease of toxin-antitoxin system